MAVKIVAIRKGNGSHNNPHEAISMYRWVNESTGKSGDSLSSTMVHWMEHEKGEAYVGSGANKAWCHVNVSTHGTKFLQTYAGGKWANNLLSLPEF